MNQQEVQKRIADCIDCAVEYKNELFENGEAGQQFERFKMQTEATVKKHPLKSVAIGLVSGYILAKIFS
jgi:ElaB/YqjD/DUF883 family membrane-anchored ribosome-binding protein